MKPISTFLRPFSALLLALFVFQGCNALNPLCGKRSTIPGYRITFCNHGHVR